MSPNIDWSANIALADCAAKILAESLDPVYKGTEKGDFNGRWIMRHWAVEGLRYLWKNGDASNRSTIAARVAVWQNRDAAKISQAVLERERARLAQK